MAAIEAMIFRDAPDQLSISDQLELERWSGPSSMLRYGVQLDSALAGLVELVFRDGEYAELQYSRNDDPRLAGRGIITQAARKLCAYSFAEQGIERIGLNIRKSNFPSIRIAQRLGARVVSTENNVNRWDIAKGSLL